MKVIVAHPDRQYVTATLNAMHQKGYLHRFYTTFAANKLSNGVAPLFKRGEKELKKRTFQGIPSEIIRHRPSLFFSAKLLKLSLFHRIKHNYVSFDKWIAQAIKRECPDIIYTFENSNLVTNQRAQQLGITTVLDLAQIHHKEIEAIEEAYYPYPSFSPSEKEWINKRKQEALEVTDYIFTLSSFAKNSLVKHGIAPERIYTVNLGINPNTFTSKTTYSTTGKFQFLYVGTLTQRKGLSCLLKAWSELNLKNAELTLIGPMADAKEMIGQHKDKISYIPFLSHEELVQKYQQADAFIFPSFLDSWAQTVIEAMACGTPVIVTENTGSKDAVKQGGGFVIPVNDVDALKEKILYFCNNRSEVERIGRRAHEVAQQYTWENYHKQVISAIEDIARKEGIPL